MFEIFSVANAAQFAVRLSVWIKALYNKLRHLDIQGNKQKGSERKTAHSRHYYQHEQVVYLFAEDLFAFLCKLTGGVCLSCLGGEL